MNQSDSNELYSMGPNNVSQLGQLGQANQPEMTNQVDSEGVANNTQFDHETSRTSRIDEQQQNNGGDGGSGAQQGQAGQSGRTSNVTGKKKKGTDKLLVAMIIVAAILTVNNTGGHILEKIAEHSPSAVSSYITTSGDITYGSVELEAFDKLVIDYASTDVKILPGDSYKVDYHLYDDQVPNFEVEGSTLKMVQPSSEKKLNVRTENTEIVVTVPMNSKFDADISLTSGDVVCSDVNVSGSIETTSGDIKVISSVGEDLSLSSTSGKIILDDVQADDLELDSTSGSLSIKDSSAASLDASSTSGSASIYGCNIDEIKQKSTSGSLNIGNSSVEKIYSDATSGSATIELEGDISDYGFDLDATSGSIYVNGTRYKDQFATNKNSHRMIEVERTSGSIQIQVR